MAATKTPELKVQEFQFHEIPKTTTWENFKQTVWDSKKREFFGRNKKSWYQLLIFYTIFYACLAALWAICMRGLLATLEDKEPKYKLTDSLIGANPGLGFRPISKKTEEGSLIFYNLNKTETSDKWISLIDEFLEPYLMEQTGKNYQDCDYNTTLEEGKVCSVKINEKFGNCSRQTSYGYNTRSPCIFLKLNRIFDWVPEFYTKSDESMPDDIKSLVDVNDTYERAVWVSCKGENPFDQERIQEFKYHPSQGFPVYYFPYTNQDNYLSPLIAVQVVNVEPYAIVNVECRAWAKNIIYSASKNNREGSVHFEILIDV